MGAGPERVVDLVAFRSGSLAGIDQGLAAPLVERGIRDADFGSQVLDHLPASIR